MFQSVKLTTSSLGSFATMFPQTGRAERPVKRAPSIMESIGEGGGGGGATGSITFKECGSENVYTTWTVENGLVTEISEAETTILIRDCSGGSS